MVCTDTQFTQTHISHLYISCVYTWCLSHTCSLFEELSCRVCCCLCRRVIQLLHWVCKKKHRQECTDQETHKVHLRTVQLPANDAFVQGMHTRAQPHLHIRLGTAYIFKFFGLLATFLILMISDGQQQQYYIAVLYYT